MKLHKLLTALVTFLMLIGPAFSQEGTVYFGSTPDETDGVGSRLAYAIKQNLLRSASLKLVTTKKPGTVSLLITTLDPNSNGNFTVYSAVWTVQTFHVTPVTMYLNSVVGSCGSSVVQTCADQLVAQTDEKASMVASWSKK